nr:uncharacterized protein CTRU02_01403 [Colletotrichum truncatum]KAF6799724.1 hypothetical protein CTRU02_01403 [Colletotrichum truncatum]
MWSEKLGSIGVTPEEFSKLSQHLLEEKLDKSFPRYIDDHNLLDIYTRWLSLQVPRLEYRSSIDTTKTVRNCCEFLGSRNYEKGVVIDAFWRHKDVYLKERPNGKREYNLAKRDIEINYKKIPNLPPTTSSRAPVTRSGILLTEADKGINSKVCSCSLICLELRGHHTKIEGSKQVNPPLTPERVYQTKTQNTPTDNNFKPPMPSKEAPPSTYLCKRCKVPGHFIQNCKTNGNPSFDGPPPKGYVCRICHEVETHFITACPRLPPSSLASSTERQTHLQSTSSKGVPRNLSSVEHLLRSYATENSGPQDDTEGILTGYLRGCSPELRTLAAFGADDTSKERNKTNSATVKPSSTQNYLNEERARYIQHHTDRYSPVSPSPIHKVGGGPMRSGSNNDPIGGRRRFDSYRPETRIKKESTKQDKVTNRKKRINVTKPVLSSKPTKKDTDGRLSPWDDIQPPLKKRRRESSAADRGLPWDDIEVPPEIRPRNYVDVSAPNNLSSFYDNSIQSATMKLAGEKKMEEKAITLEYPEEIEKSFFEADSFLERFGRELAYYPDSQILNAPEDSKANKRNNGNAFSPSLSSGNCSELLSSPAARPSDGSGDGDCMEGAPPSTFEYPRDICEIGRDQACYSQFIKPYHTLKPLWRDPPYDRWVLDLFRGREHTNVYVNIIHRSTAIGMYKDDEETSKAGQMSNLAV